MNLRLQPAVIVALLLLVFFALYRPPPLEAGEAPGNLTGPAGEDPERAEEELAYAEARAEMVRTQLASRGITDPAVLRAMGEVRRHEFVPDSQKGSAYEDHPLPIGEGQTISQPYIVALMTQALDLSGGERVLEVGTGSGYQAAVLGELTGEVYTVEIIGALAERAAEDLDRLGYSNVHVKNADGYYGWEEHAPFDAVIVTAAASHVPPPLLEQLKDGGLLIIPLGSQRYYQTLTLIEKRGEETETTHLTSVRFVPMTGRAQE